MSDEDDTRSAYAVRGFLYLLVFMVCFISGIMAALNHDVWRELGYVAILSYMVVKR